MSVSEHDRPSTDGGGRNGQSSEEQAATTVASIASPAAALDNGPASISAAEEGDLDVHSCGRCKLQFFNIDDFIRHKLQHGDCRLQYKKSGHLKLPKLIKKDTPVSTESTASVGAVSASPSSSAVSSGLDAPPAKRRRGRPRKVQMSGAAAGAADSTPSDGQTDVAEAERAPEHRCSTCGTGFHRKAALKCHQLQEHGVDSDVDSDADENDDGDNSEVDGCNGRQDGYDSTDNEWSEGVTGEIGSGSSRTACSAGSLAAGSTSCSAIGGGGSDRRRRGVLDASLPVTSGPPFPCSRCAKTFSSLDALRAHGITHSMDRAFPCSVEDCHFAFKTKGSLKRHLRRHTDERPYKCNVCSRAFRESGALTRHLKSRTPCTNKSDADLPRYGKSLSLTASTSTVPYAGLGSCGSDLSVLGAVENELAVDSSASQDAMGDGSAAASSTLCLRPCGQPSTTFDGSAPDAATTTAFGSRPGGCTQLCNIQKCCQVCKVHFESTNQLMEHLRSHLVQQQHQQPVQCGLCGHTAASGDALDEHVAQQHGSELDAKVIDEALDPTSALDDVDMEKVGDDEEDELAVGSSRSSAARSPASSSSRADALGSAGVGAGSDDAATADAGKPSDLADDVGGFATGLSPNGPGNIVVVKLNDAEEEEEEDEEDCCSSQRNSSSSEVRLDGAGGEGGDDGTANHSAPDVADDPETARSKRVRDSTLAVQQLLQLSALMAAARATPSDDGSRASEAAACQSTKMAVALAQRTCPVCKRTFKAGSYLRLHMRSHTGERPHKCPHCPKDFATKDTFNKHLLAHSDERLYKCGECGKMFKRISHVKEHLKIHSSERPYPCVTCDKSFKTSNAWKVHMRTHSQVMAWRCSACPRQFREKSSLVRHARTHTGERPFPCKFCGRQFSEHGTLNRHLRAKVPCTFQLSQLRMQQSLCDESLSGISASSPPAVVCATSGGFQTVLAEFSSVAADSQYIDQDGSNGTGGRDGIEQCIVLEQGSSISELQSLLPGNTDHNTTGRDVDTGASLPTFLVVRGSGSSIRVHYACDDELFQQAAGPFEGSETVLMLQSPATTGASETAAGSLTSEDPVGAAARRNTTMLVRPTAKTGDGDMLVTLDDEYDDEGGIGSSTVVVSS